MGVVSAVPASRLGELEDVIERGLAAAGEALREIRESRLYLESHATFEDYCQGRWQMTRQHVNRQIAAATKIAVLEPIGSTPTHEAVLRELPSADQPVLLREVWVEAVERHGEKPTAAQVREVVDEKRDGKMAVHYSSATDEWATPQDFFDVVAAEFDFDLDVCALPSSAKCERFFSPEDDGLAQEWAGTVWMNPPYGDEIGKWVKKAFESALAGATVVCLVPARTDTAWFQDHCLDQGEVRFIRGRLKFGAAEASAPFPSCLVILGPGVGAEAFGWAWR